MTTPDTTSPKPTDMPGATANPQLREPISTAPPPPAATPPPAPQQPPANQAPQQQAPAAPATGTEQEVDWKEHARTWESRAKGKGWDEVAEKARKYDEEQAAKRTREEQQAVEIAEAVKRAERAEAEAARERVARETGVLPQLLGNGTEEEMRAAAALALEWRGPGTQAPPPPQTAAVSASAVTSADTLGSSPNQVPQLNLEQFRALNDAERMAAVRAGQCENLGVGKPKAQRRMGNQLELGASMSGGGPVTNR